MSGEALELPRAQTGSSPQHLLTTLLGDYWLDRTEPLPSTALVDLLGEFDISPVGARAAMSRSARRGTLVMTKQGRNSFYGINPRTVSILADGGRRIVEFGREDVEWDGHWTLVSFSLPEHQSELRYPLRSQLRWLGFAPLYDGLWVSPRLGAQESFEALGELDLTQLSVFRAIELPGTRRAPIEAWDLVELRRKYADFIDTWQPLRHQVHAGALSPATALVTRTRIMDSWRGFPSQDPDLPARLLPAGWPRRQARDLFIDLYDSLGPLAAVRVRQIVGRHSSPLAELVTHRDTAMLMAYTREG